MVYFSRQVEVITSENVQNHCILTNFSTEEFSYFFSSNCIGSQTLQNSCIFTNFGQVFVRDSPMFFYICFSNPQVQKGQVSPNVFSS